MSEELKDFLYELLSGAVQALEKEEDGSYYLNTNNINGVYSLSSEEVKQIKAFTESLFY